MREVKHLSIHQWLRSAIPDSQQPSSPIGFLFLKLPPPPCAVLLVLYIVYVYILCIIYSLFSIYIVDILCIVYIYILYMYIYFA